MRRILSVWFTTLLLVAISASVPGQDAPLPAVAETATTPSPPVPEEPAPGADGTTSVVVPPPVEAPPPVAPPSPPAPEAVLQPTEPPAPPPSVFASPPGMPDPIPPPSGDAPLAPPSNATPTPPRDANPPPASDPQATPPSSVPPPPPPSETAAVLEGMLAPFKGRLAGVSGVLDPQLYARPMPLLEPLVRSGDRSRRLWIVQAYWKVSAGYANVRTSAEALERLELIAPGGDPYDRATLDVAVAGARADLADARTRLGTAQQELMDLARLPVGEPLPWPIDRPLSDPYQTHFEAIFANRIATGRVRTIVRSLPARHEAVASRAIAVTSATKAVEMAEADHARGKRPIESVINAHAALVAQQAAFVEAVRVYNVEIAEYAMAVADLNVPDEQFVSMLIAAPRPWQAQPIAPVSATVAPPGPPASPPKPTAFPPPLAPAVTGITIE